MFSGSFEHGHEHSGSMKGQKFLKKLSDRQNKGFCGVNYIILIGNSKHNLP